MQSIYQSDVDGVKRAVDNSVSVKQTDKDGRTVLMQAVLADGCNPAIIALLIEHGVSIKHKDLGQAWSALAFAARDRSSEICKILLDAGAEVDDIDAFGNTPLWRAVMAKNEGVVKLLTDYGANPNLANKSGVSPRLLAERLGLTYFE